MYTQIKRVKVQTPNQQPTPYTPNPQQQDNINFYGLGNTKPQYAQTIQTAANIVNGEVSNTVNNALAPINNVFKTLQTNDFWITAGGVIVGIVLLFLAISAVLRDSVTPKLAVSNPIKRKK